MLPARAASALDTAAVFSLDGVRLVRNDDSATNATYPLVTARGRILVAPHKNAQGYVSWFQALYPDGTVARYGTGEDVAFQMPSYPIVRSTNIDGEKIEYDYSVDTTDGNHTLVYVRYGFNSSGPSTGLIIFSSTQQTAYGYYAGKKVKRAPRLTTIVSRSGNTNLYTYGLTYESVQGASLLTSISLTNSAGHQLPPLNFTYGHTASPHTGNDSLKVIHSYSFSDSLNTSGRNDAVLRRGKFLRGNYNDGVIAYISKPIYGQVSNNVYQCCYPTNLFVEYVAALVDNAPVGFWFISDSGFQTLEAVDTDGDGVDEVVEVYSGTTTSTGTNLIIKIWRSDEDGEFQLSDTHTVFMPGSIQGGGTYSPYNRTYRWGDFLGTGKTQLLVINYRNNGFDRAQEPNFTLIDLENGTKLYEDGLIEITLANEGRLLCMDIDGDSRTDVCWTDNTGLHKYGFDGADFILEKTYSNITPSIITADNVSFTDINADGYIDIVKPTPPGGQWTMWLNTGESFEAKVITLTSATGYGFFFMDINRDGYPDIIRLSSSSMGYYLNIDGTSFGSYQNANTPSISINGILPPNVVDYTSMCALVKLNGSTVCEYGFTSYAPEQRQLVQSEDSYGKILRNTYGYLPQSALLWTENPTWTDTTGYQLRTLPIYVLKGARGLMSGDSGAPVILQDTYKWCDGVVNVRGLGFCGFSKSTATNSLGYPSQVTVCRYNPRKAGVPEQVAKHLASEVYTPYSTITYTYDNHSTTYGKLSPRLTGSTETSTLTNITRTTSVTYDSYDFPTKTVESSRIGSGTPLYRTTSITYTHSNDTTSYVLGAVNTSTVSTERDGNTSTKWIERTSLTYDSSFHPLIRFQSVSQDSVSFNVVSKEQWTYDSKGNVLTEKSAPYNSQEYVGTTYTYDSSGRHLLTSTDALGHTTTYSSFNQYGSPATATDYRNRVTSLTYDTWGSRTGATHPDGTVEATTTAWGGSGSYTVSRTVTGSPDTVVDYDALGREVRSAEKTFMGPWRKVTTAYDAKGRVSYVTYPYRGTTWTSKKAKYTYDVYGRPTNVEDDSGAQTTWSYSGTSVTETKEGISITRTTNAFGDLVGATDAGGTTTYTLRDDGNPSSVSVTCSNVSTVTTLSYDAYGRRTSITDPSAGTRTTSYTWNTDGTSSTTQTNDKGSITTSLDKYGRVTTITRPNSFNTAYTYDIYGRLVSEVSTNSTSEEYTYDAYDRPVTAKQYVPDGKWLQKAYTYGDGSNVTAIAYTSQDGYITTESYTYTYGHNTSVKLPDGTAILTLSAENDLGQPTVATSAGILREYGYTQYGFPTYRKIGSGTKQHLYTTFDPATGNLTSRGHTAPGQTSVEESFSYDPLGRLVSAGGGVITYSSNGNVVGKGGVGAMTYSSTGSPYKIDRLYATYSSVTRVNTQTITYSEYDRPATITEGQVVASVTYDADYERVKMLTTAYGSPISAKYYIGGRYEYEVTTSGTTVQRLFLGGDAYNAPMVLQKTGSGDWTPYLIGRDYLGSITHIVDTSGSLVAEYSYDAWGRMRNPLTFTPYSISSEPSLLLGRGYCGHEHLPIFGLINMNARLYDPVTGRFLSPDPYVQAPYFSQNFNRYSYALNNPMKYSDKSGEYVIVDSFLIGLIGGGWERAKQMAWNDLKLWGGLFVVDKNKGLVGGAWEFVSRITWQLPQTAMGFFVNQTVNTFRIGGGIEKVEYLHGATISKHYKDNWGGITFGSFIMGDNSIEARDDNDLFQHEYGHYLQSQEYGAFWLIGFAIESGISSLVNDYDHHNAFYTEQDANARALKYFAKNYGGGYAHSIWDFNSNPINGYNQSKTYRDNISIIEGNIYSLIISRRRKDCIEESVMIDQGPNIPAIDSIFIY